MTWSRTIIPEPLHRPALGRKGGQVAQGQAPAIACEERRDASRLRRAVDARPVDEQDRPAFAPRRTGQTPLGQPAGGVSNMVGYVMRMTKILYRGVAIFLIQHGNPQPSLDGLFGNQVQTKNTESKQ